ncbi:hypothetical protein [Streptococcus equi]|uniref:phage tail protein n=1 Tax=Streptococcus equi TaxID=1336 RepID=UPI002F2B1D4B|nr:hypothetical protein [Streptococcus equi subsp. equi]
MWNIDLFGAGQAIINGFLNGLRSMWGAVTDFVGGIASWIAANKGPISYDRVLLKPHGKAIMDGLGNSMKTNFKDIQKDVSGMADDLTRSFQIKRFNGFLPEKYTTKLDELKKCASHAWRNDFSP